MIQNEDLFGGVQEKPLVPAMVYDQGDGIFVFDEDGSLFPILPLAPSGLQTLSPRASLLNTLDGSWLVNFSPKSEMSLDNIRGPMRIEVGDERVRISGDIYVKQAVFEPGPAEPRPVTSFIPESLVIRQNWYPSFPKEQYRWYFRSSGVTYTMRDGKGVLYFKFTRHLWDGTTEEFVRTDTGWMRLNCSTTLFQLPGWQQLTIKMSGEAMIGGVSYNVTAAKTSPYYRGCLVEYAAHGVEEYWIVDPTAETVEQYRLTAETFELVVKVKDGPIESFVIPGFTIPVRAIFDDAENRAALQQLL